MARKTPVLVTENPDGKKAPRQKQETATPTRSSTEGLDLSYLEGTLGYSIRRAQMAVFQDIFQSFGELAVTTVQFSVLAVVADNPGTNQADLALALGVERPRIVPILDALEARGLAIRKPSPSDRRHRLLFLTDQGQALLEELKKRFALHQKRMLDRLGEESIDAFLSKLWSLATIEKSS
jgi:DNA-binding MarR family transcriptional regulator